MKNQDFEWLKWISEVQSIAQAGLTYSENEFDKERYTRLRQLISELAAHCSGNEMSNVANIFALEQGYHTPKVDVRSFVLKENKLLLVRERADGCWTLPGGWADVNESASEAVIRETKEEAGFDVSAIKLLALWDKLKHDHPPQWPHVYKCFFHCEILSGEETESLEISEVGFFDLDKLPPLSVDRITETQIMRLYELVIHPQSTQFD